MHADRLWRPKKHPGVEAWHSMEGPTVIDGVRPKIRFALDSPLEGAVHCELVSEVKIPAPVTKLGADSGRVMG